MLYTTFDGTRIEIEYANNNPASKATLTTLIGVSVIVPWVRVNGIARDDVHATIAAKTTAEAVCVQLSIRSIN